MTCLYHAECYFSERLEGSTRPVAKPTGAHAMDFNPRETSGNRVGSLLASEMNSLSVPEQLASQSLRWKQMPTGSARSQHK